jgi:chemotaxis protein methyltransferase CheR
MNMTPDDFEFISQMLKKRSGLALTQDKMYLLESRLMPLARTNNCADLTAFIRMLRIKPDEKVVAEVVDAMTTNESMFFRDQKPFDQLRQVILPRFKAAHPSGGRMKIWSAACSNGQEPYSIAMCLQEEAPKMAGFTYDITGTDISPRVLEKARQGIYTQFEVQRGLPITMMLKYFKQLPDNTWQANDVLRSMVTFRQANLLDPYTRLGIFDLILCRNVLIYFDEPTKRNILERMSEILTPGGVLLLGSTESVMGVTQKFRQLDDQRGLHVLAA